MGERRERPTKRLENADLMALAKQSVVADETSAVARPQAEGASDDDPLADWEDTPVRAIATGSQSNALPTTSRTATLADPLTTQLLAEVARQTATVEVDPDDIAEGSEPADLGEGGRDTRRIDLDALNEALKLAEEPPAPVASANLKRRT